MKEVTPTRPIIEPQSKSMDWGSILQFGLSLFATVLFWGLGAILFLVGFIERLDPAAQNLTTSSFMFVGTCLFSGLIALFSTLFSARKLFGFSILNSKSIHYLKSLFRPGRLILLFPILLIMGSWVIQETDLSWLLLPPIHILATLLPLIWIGWISIRGITNMSMQRFWGSFSSGMMISPMLALFLEIFGAILILFLVVGLLNTNADIERILNSLAIQFSSINPESVQFETFIANLINSPMVIGAALLFIAVITPLVEEIVKPIGVWLLGGRDLTPKDGWVLGVISGAGFALFENLWLLNADESWATLVTARVATNVIHLLTSGMTGWALALAWQKKNYVRLAATYFLSVIIHAIWNASILLISISNITSLASHLDNPAIIPNDIHYPLGIGLGFLAIGSFLVLYRVNQKFQDEAVVKYEVVINGDFEAGN